MDNAIATAYAQFRDAEGRASECRETYLKALDKHARARDNLLAVLDKAIAAHYRGEGGE